MALFASETWTMRHRLLLTIGSILVVCQLISVFWLWHESKEQIQLLVASAIEGHNNQKHVEHEVREAVASLLIPSLLIVGLALYISLVAVRKITRPLSNLQTELESRTPDNLQPITLTESVPEVTAVTTAINQLVSRLNLTLDRERLFTADVAHELRTPLAVLRGGTASASRTDGESTPRGGGSADPASGSDDQQHLTAAAAGARRAVIFRRELPARAAERGCGRTDSR